MERLKMRSITICDLCKGVLNSSSPALMTNHGTGCVPANWSIGLNEAISEVRTSPSFQNLQKALRKQNRGCWQPSSTMTLKASSALLLLRCSSMKTCWGWGLDDSLGVIFQSSWPQELLGPSVCSTLHVAPPIFHRNGDGKGDRGAGGAGSRCGKNPGSWKWVDQYRRNLLAKNEFWWNEPCSWDPPSTIFDQVVRELRQRCRFYPNVFQVEVSSNAEACCCIPAGQLRSENGGSLHVFVFCFPKVAHRSAAKFAPIFQPWLRTSWC